VKTLDAHKEHIKLMHKYLDGDLTKEEELVLSKHLEECEACQKHFHELNRTIALIQSTEQIAAPLHFTENVMKSLPKEKKRMKVIRLFKGHPFLVAAAVFFVFMFGGMFSFWNQSNELVVSKTDNLIIQGDTVIVPEGVTIEDDLLIKNGNLVVKGKIDGNVTIFNGKLIEEEPSLDQEGLMASVGEVNGELKTVDRIFEWIWYHINELIQKVFAM